MRMLLSGLVGSTNRGLYPQVFQAEPKPSLQFAIEIVQNTDNTKYVQAHLGDKDLILGGCTSVKCDIETFKTYLASVAKLDVPTVCASQLNKMELYQ